MKTLWIVAGLFIANTTFAACPNLAGSYVCTVDGQQMQLVVAQSVANGVTSYQIAQDGTAWSPIVTDGTERDFTGIANLQNGRYTAACDANTAVNMSIKGKVFDNGQAMGNLTLTLRASLDSANNMIQNVNGELTGDFGTFPINQQNNTCMRR